MTTTLTVERGLRLVAGAFVLASVILGVYVNPWFLAFTAFVGANLLQSAFTNWCPMMAILRRLGFRAAAIVILAAVTAAPAQAQDSDPGGVARTIAFTGGGATTASTAGALIGGTVIYDVNRYLALEGQGAWFDRGARAEAYMANAGVLANLVPRGRPAVPYLAAGAGVYRASFEVPFVAGGWSVDWMPRFYARRMAMMPFRPAVAFEARTFTDPVVTMGGGVRVTLAAHFELRPDARALVVLDGGNSHTIGVFGLNVGYRF
jgi:hypothetical protein